MSFPEEQEDKIIQFALTPKDYYYELKLAKFLYRIDRWAYTGRSCSLGASSV